MKVWGDVQPTNRFFLDNAYPGKSVVRFYENVQPYTETHDDVIINGWEYDEYILEMPRSTQADIETNFDALLQQAKAREAKQSNEVAELEALINTILR